MAMPEAVADAADAAQEEAGQEVGHSVIEITAGGDTVDGLDEHESNKDIAGDNEMKTPTPNNGLPTFKDDFTLKYASSKVHFRGSRYRIYEHRSSQIQLEAQDVDVTTEGSEIVVKKIKDAQPFGLNFLRGSYTLVCLFFSGFLFVFCFQVLLFLFMDLVAKSGLNGDERGRSVAGFLGTLGSIPLFIHGLSSTMALVGTFTSDAWQGQPFFRKVGNWSIIVTEVASFVMFLGIPLVTCIVSLFSGTDQWWPITSLTWFCSVTVYFAFFAGSVIYYELAASFWILRQLADRSHSGKDWKSLFQSDVLIRQKYQFSGILQLVKVVGSTQQEEQDIRHQSKSLYSRMTEWSCCGRLFHKLDPYEPARTTEDVLGSRRFVTAKTWSLEKIYFLNQRANSVAVVNGPSALEPNQMFVSFACSVVGNMILALLIISFLVWYQDSAVFVACIIVLVVLCCIPRIRSSAQVYEMYRNVNAADIADSDEHDTEPPQVRSNDENNNVGIYQTFEVFFITRPTDCLSWSIFILEILCLVLYPLIVLFIVENYPIAVLFLFTAVISGARYFLNPAVLIKELGTLDQIGYSDRGGPVSYNTWKRKSRFTTILLSVSRGATRKTFGWIFGFLAFAAIAFSVASFGEDYQNTASQVNGMTLLPVDDFAYEPQPNLPYPSCRMSKGLEIPTSNSTSLADYTFLADLEYEPPDTIQAKLDQWFGEGVATDRQDIVDQFRMQVAGGNAPVTYNLYTFPGDVGVVSVRGSTTAWEWLTDAQLWSGAGLFGSIRWLLPGGSIWTPIMDELLKALSFIESATLKRIALYQQTTSFVEILQASGNFTKLFITGQSLGGGIAIITGAQTGIPAIAVSGPNAMMSRKTFDPPITEAALNEYVFNIVPDHDPIPRIDDLGRLYQRIACHGEPNNIWSCHTGVRSLCEIIYTCGTNNRPGLCECATLFGYPVPTQTGGNATFSDICGDQRSNAGYP